MTEIDHAGSWGSRPLECERPTARGDNESNLTRSWTLGWEWDSYSGDLDSDPDDLPYEAMSWSDEDDD